MSVLGEINDSASPASSQPEVLREAMVEQLCEQGHIRTARVARAFRAVPRHLFAPGVSLDEAYANDVVRTKRDEHGVTISSISAPWLQAMMLEQAELRPGMRCLEIGSGGYNAALMAELVGPSGEVTTVQGIAWHGCGITRQAVYSAPFCGVSVVSFVRSCRASGW